MRLSVVCYLDPESTALVRGIQQKLSEITGAKASLELWKPHVTVGDGIEVNNNELEIVQSKLSNLAKNTTAFDITLRDVLKIDSRKGGEGENTTPYGLYLDVNVNDKLLDLVAGVSKVSEDFKKWYVMPRPYQPHCALAFKDLTKEGFDSGIEYLDTQVLSLDTKIDHVAIVEILPNQTREFARFHFL